MKAIKWLFRIVFACVFLFAAAVAALGIYTLSAEDAGQSGARSSQVTERLKQEVREHIESSPQGLAITERVKALVIEHSPYGSNWDANVRKLAHFSLYFVLGGILYMVLSILRFPFWLKWILCIAACFGYACTDEIHQSEVAGRYMSKMDVLIDTAGAFTSVTLLTIWGKFLKWLGS